MEIDEVIDFLDKKVAEAELEERPRYAEVFAGAAQALKEWKEDYQQNKLS